MSNPEGSTRSEEGSPPTRAALEQRIAELEARLRQREDRYAQLVHYATDGIVTGDLEMNLDGANPRFCDLVGYSEQELQSMNLADFILPEDLARVPAQSEPVRRGETVHTHRRFRHRDGSVLHVEIRARQLPDGAVLGVVRDLTDRRRAERALATEQERLAAVLHSLQEAVLLLDEQARIVTTNQAACELLGQPAERLSDCDVHEVLHLYSGEEPVDSRALLARFWDPPSRTAQTAQLEFRRDGAGASRWILVSGSRFRHQEEPGGLVLVLRDITALSHAQEELQRTRRMASLGVMAGGIAHDFNNVLTAIRGSAELLRLAIDEPHRRERHVRSLERSVDRAMTLTGRLLTFAKGGEPRKELLDIRALLDSTLDPARIPRLDAFHERVDPAARVTPTLYACDAPWSVRADPNQVRQVFDNLLSNAIRAMPDGGPVEVSLDNALLVSHQAPPLPAGRYVRIRFRDHGEGIPAEHLARIFDPFFEAGERGRCGLGLSTAFSVVRRHGGYLFVESGEGSGALFTVYLPAVSDRAVSDSRDSDSDPPCRRVLVMDDDDSVRDVAREALEALGCEVQIAAEGGEAVTRFVEALEAGRPPDLCILDLTVLQGMGGVETARRILELAPEAVLAVSSGYSDDPVLADPAAYGFRAAVAKPWNLADLRRVLGLSAR